MRGRDARDTAEAGSIRAGKGENGNPGALLTAYWLLPGNPMRAAQQAARETERRFPLRCAAIHSHPAVADVERY
jgi:hypothetical protein